MSASSRRIIRSSDSPMNVCIVQAFYAQKGPFTKLGNSGTLSKLGLKMTKFPILPMLNNPEQIIIDSLKNIVEPRILCLHICFLIRGRWKTNFVGPLGLRWRKSNMAAMK